jgi:hypothetical protein
MREMRIEGAHLAFYTTDPAALEKLADEATRIRMWGSEPVIVAFEAAGDTYRLWANRDDGTLTEPQQQELHVTCREALTRLEVAVRNDLANQ